MWQSDSQERYVGMDAKPFRDWTVSYAQTVPTVKTKTDWELDVTREVNSALMPLNLIQEQKLQTSVLVHVLTARCGLWLPYLSWERLIKTGRTTVESVWHRIQYVNAWSINGWINFTSRQFLRDHYKVCYQRERNGPNISNTKIFSPTRKVTRGLQGRTW